MSVYLLSGTRTPIGSFLGGLSSISASELGAVAIQQALKQAQVKAEAVDEVFMGSVLTAGQGQAPARQAALKAGLPESVPCTTIGKVCGSGLKSVINGIQAIKAQDVEVVVAGGMENMSQAPHLLMNSRQGTKFGAQEMKDSMQWDGLWDVYSDRAMGNCAEECTKKYQLSREEQDQYAIESFKRARKAQEEKIFTAEIAPVLVKSRKSEILVEADEGPAKANFEKIPKLRPAFEKEGTITAANASTLNDGAAAVVLAGENYKEQAKFKICGYAGHAQNSTWFTTAPIQAMQKSLDKAGLQLSDIDLFEINEAFAAVPLVAIKELKLDPAKVNIYGGAVSLGHPIGCSGTRILVTLMNALTQTQKRYGMASICIGGGEALSLIIERL